METQLQSSETSKPRYDLCFAELICKNSLDSHTLYVSCCTIRLGTFYRQPLMFDSTVEGKYSVGSVHVEAVSFMT